MTVDPLSGVLLAVSHDVLVGTEQSLFCVPSQSLWGNSWGLSGCELISAQLFWDMSGFFSNLVLRKAQRANANRPRVSIPLAG